MLNTIKTNLNNLNLIIFISNLFICCENFRSDDDTNPNVIQKSIDGNLETKENIVNNLKPSIYRKRNILKLPIYESADTVAFYPNQLKCDPNYIYVRPKYMKFKNEIQYNNICTLSDIIFNDQIEKAKKKSKLSFVRNCTPKCIIGDIREGSNMTLDHILAIILYTDFDSLCFNFRKYWRIKTNREHNYGEYGNWGRFLFEVVNCYGTNQYEFDVLYHGLNNKFLFSNNVVFPGTFSTTESYSVSRNFKGSKGMILYISNNTRSIDVSYFSTHPEEEYLFMNRPQELINLVYLNKTYYVPYVLKNLFYLLAGHIMANDIQYQVMFFDYLDLVINFQELSNLEKNDQMICHQIEHILYEFDNFIILNQTITQIKTFLKDNNTCIPKLLLDFNNICYGKKIVDFARDNDKSIYYFKYNTLQVTNPNGRYILGYKTIEIKNEIDKVDYLVFILVEFILDDGKFLLYGHQIVDNYKNQLDIHVRFSINGNSFSNDYLTSDRHFLHYFDRNLSKKININYLLYYEKPIIDPKSKQIQTELIQLKLQEVKQNDISQKFQKYYLNRLYLPNKDTQCFECTLNHNSNYLYLIKKYPSVVAPSIKFLHPYRFKNHYEHSSYKDLNLNIMPQNNVTLNQLKNKLANNNKNLDNNFEIIKNKKRIFTNRKRIYNPIFNRLIKNYYLVSFIILIYTICIKNLLLYFKS